MDSSVSTYSENTFESIKHVNKYGQEYWIARELQHALEYTEWRNFESVIEKAEIACDKSGNPSAEHFVDVTKSYQMPNGGEREMQDYALSRYACYLIVQKGKADDQ